MDTYDIDFIDQSGGEWTHTTRYKALREENARLHERVEHLEQEKSEWIAMQEPWNPSWRFDHDRAEAAEKRVEELERLNRYNVAQAKADAEAAEAKLARVVEAAERVVDGAAMSFADEYGRISYEEWQLEPDSIPALRAALRAAKGGE